MDIRAAETSDIPVLAAMWDEAFPGERNVKQRVRQLEAGGVYGGIETAFIAFENGEPCGAFRAYALQQYIDARELPMMGLAAVAVRPAFRRRGIGAHLCRFAIQHAHGRGDVLSALYPFRPSFYADLGWALAGSLQSFRFDPGSSPPLVDEPRVSLFTGDTDFLNACYEAVAVQSNGLIRRSRRIWQQHLDWPDVHAHVLTRDDKCAGYIIARHDRRSTDRKGVLTIRELIAVDAEAYSELLGWVSLQREEFGFVHYDALPEERFDLRLREPRTPGAPVARTLFSHVATLIRGPMVRVISVEKSLGARAGARDCTFTLHVTDPVVSVNETMVTVSARNKSVHIDRVANPGATHVATDIGTYSQIFVGEITVLEAVQLGKARVTGDAESVSAFFRTRRCFNLLDEF